MQNSMVIFTFFVSDQKYLFWQIWSKKLKLLVRAEIWCPDQFEYEEFNGDVFFSVVDWKHSFILIFFPKLKIAEAEI